MPFHPLLSPSEVQAAVGPTYSSLNPLFNGGQGTVFVAQFERGGGQKVALKVYHHEFVEARTEREVRAMTGMNCSNVVRLLDWGQIQIRGHSCTYMATEYVEGTVLSERLQSGSLSVPEVAEIGVGVAKAVATLWERRIVHRDIKPSNIIVRPSGEAVLIDLGVARHLALDTLTTTGKTWGTMGYMSPEQASARKALTCKSDIYALGVVLQECLAGRHPTGRDQTRLLMGPPPTASLAPHADSVFTGAVDRMLEFSPQLRPRPCEAATSLEVWRN